MLLFLFLFSSANFFLFFKIYTKRGIHVLSANLLIFGKFLLSLSEQSLFLAMLEHLSPLLLPSFDGRVDELVELELLIRRVLQTLLVLDK